MDSYKVLPREVGEEIAKYIEKKWEEEKLSKRYPNRILRKDVLEILDIYCTVVYFPIEDRNNGFHLTGIPDQNGKDEHIVFINTQQTMEKQVFTAAHELGHVWEIDKYVARKCGLSLTEDDNSERIINRFAAELLMPMEEFQRIFNTLFLEYKSEDDTITIINLLKLVASLMNNFLAPMKAVFMRLVEIEEIPEDVISFLLARTGTAKDGNMETIVSTAIQRIIAENGYTELQKGSGRRWIEGLPELLEKAEEKGTVSQEKIEALREKFGLKRHGKDQSLEKSVSFITKQGGNDDGDK